jgi:hypothetical protein
MNFFFWIAIWYVCGLAGFIYWWTREFPLTWRRIPLMLLCGSMGPLTWLVGWNIHGKEY